jgi:hypothetical protein
MKYIACNYMVLIYLLLLSATIASCNQNEKYHGDSVTMGTPIVLSDDGGWCWFQDPRVVVVDNFVVIGSVANGRVDSLRAGNVEAIVFDFETNESSVVTLHESLEANDHATPAFLVRPDGRLLVIYTMHNQENNFYYRISEPHDPTR